MFLLDRIKSFYTGSALLEKNNCFSHKPQKARGCSLAGNGDNRPFGTSALKGAVKKNDFLIFSELTRSNMPDLLKSRKCWGTPLSMLRPDRKLEVISSGSD